MATKNTPHILFIHSDVRSYRVPIFQMLHDQYPTQFVFMYGGGLAKQFYESTKWNYTNLKQYPMVGYSSDFSPRLIRELIKRRNAYDIIISSGLASFATHASFLIAKILRKKFIVWAEDWVWSHAFVARIALPYIRFIVRHADACIAAGTKTRDFFIALGVKPEKVFVAPNCALDLNTVPIDSQKLEEMRQNINPRHKIVISYLGRIVRYKALDTLIEAFAQLEKERDDVLLLIVGDGPFAPYCKELIDKLRIKNFYWPQYANLTATKAVEAIPPQEFWYYYRISDIFVLPGRFIWDDNVPCESWGFTINEALSLGILTISTTSVAAAHDLLDKEQISKEGSMSSLLERLKYLLTLPLQEVGQRQRETLYSTITYQKMFNGFNQAIKSIL